MTTPQITTPGDPPDPLAPQPTFRATFYAYLQQLVTAFGQANTVATWMGTTADTVATNATTASNAAGTATTKAGEAATSASNAATSESNAATSATASATSATASATSLTSFRSVYLGEQASDPTQDLNGDPLTGGEFYINSGTGSPRMYSGGAWRDAALDPSGALMAASNLSDLADVATARDNLGLAAIYLGKSWATKTGAYTAIAGDRILADTSGGAFTVTLPASPTSGDELWFADPGSNWATNALTVSGNGNNIDGASTFSADVNEGAFVAIYNGTAWVVRLATGVA